MTDEKGVPACPAPTRQAGVDGAASPERERAWSWDSSHYAGSAGYYAVGRVAYSAELVTALVEALRLDGSGVLLDVGCGPGSLTLLLAPHVASALGVDADADMLGEASRLADEQQVRHVTWRELRAEDPPARPAQAAAGDVRAVVPLDGPVSRRGSGAPHADQ